MNLIGALHRANDKSREFLRDLDDTAEALHGAGKTAEDDDGLRISKHIQLALIKATERAIESGDIAAMVLAAQAHGIEKEIER